MIWDRAAILPDLPRALALAVAVYAAVVAAVAALQRRFIYFPPRPMTPQPPPPPPGAEWLQLRSGDGTRLAGLFFPPPADGAPVVLLFHGNAAQVLDYMDVLQSYRRRGLGALAVDPRGYAWSEGSPSEAGWLMDAEAALQWLGGRGIEPQRVVLHGVSIGSGPAVHLASRHPVRGLILQAPFTSLPDVAAEHYRWLPVRLFLRDRFDNAERAPRVRCPVLLLHGTADATIPGRHSEELARRFPGPVQLVLVPGAGHNELPLWPGYWEAIERFLLEPA